MNPVTSGGQTIGKTLTTGIQDISALLPLLGTEQCEDHVASALTNGFFCAAAMPLSLFGSLGIARAGFKTLMSTISIPPPKSIPWLRFEGAKLLAHAGFKPQGVNMSLIMLDEDRKSYCAEKLLDSMMKDLHIEDSNRIAVSAKTWRWNIMMIIFSGLSSVISIAPYVHLNLHEPNVLNHFVRWTFPTIRAIGGFLTTTMIQLVIQRRLLVIVRKWLILKGLREEELADLDIDVNGITSLGVHYPSLDERFSLLERRVTEKLNPSIPSAPNDANQHCSRRGLLARQLLDRFIHRCAATAPPSSTDIEKPVPELNAAAIPNLTENQPEVENSGHERLEVLQRRINQATGSPVLIWIFLVLLLVGVLASISGYVGCFSAVQGSGSPNEALIWLGLEAGLSVVRIILWGINPRCDDAPPLKFTFELDKHAPPPTCARSAENIEKNRELLLVRAPEFLEYITSYAGLLQRFADPTLTLYYTLTRRCHADNSSSAMSLMERVLYITIFDHTERTTRVYTENYRDDPEARSQDDGTSVVTTDESSNPTYFYSADPITVELEHGILKTRLGHQICHDGDPITMNKTLQTALTEHYRSILTQINCRIGKRLEHDAFEYDWRMKFEKMTSKMQSNRGGGSIENGSEYVYQKRDLDYLEQGRLERNVRDLVCVRGKWIEDYLEWLSHWMKEKVRDFESVHNTRVGTDLKHDVDGLLLLEKGAMEIILTDEVRGWEEKLGARLEGVIEEHHSSGMRGEEVRRKWRTDMWERVKEGRRAMEARIKDTDSKAQNHKLGWQYTSRWIRVSEGIHSAWQSLFEQLSTSLSSHPSAAHCSSWECVLEDWETERMYARTGEVDSETGEPYSETEELHAANWNVWFGAREEGMKRRLRSEAKDVEERLQHGLGHCHEFKSSQFLVDLTHSESKWLYIGGQDVDDARISALKRNHHVTHLEILSEFPGDITQLFDAITRCTSILWDKHYPIPANIQLSPNILSITAPNTTLSNEHQEILVQNLAQLEKTQRTTFEFADMVSQGGELRVCETTGKFTIRFFGPSSGFLKLQFTHNASCPEIFLKIEMNGSLVLKHPVPESVSEPFEEIMIHNECIPSSSSKLTFKPDCWNTLVCIAMEYYELSDIGLVDEHGVPYQPTDVKNNEDRSQDSEAN